MSLRVYRRKVEVKAKVKMKKIIAAITTIAIAVTSASPVSGHLPYAICYKPNALRPSASYTSAANDDISGTLRQDQIRYASTGFLPQVAIDTPPSIIDAALANYYGGEDFKKNKAYIEEVFDELLGKREKRVLLRNIDFTPFINRYAFWMEIGFLKQKDIQQECKEAIKTALQYLKGEAKRAPKRLLEWIDNADIILDTYLSEVFGLKINALSFEYKKIKDHIIFVPEEILGADERAIYDGLLNKVILPVSGITLGDLIHEGLHLNSIGIRNPYLDEGITYYLTLYILCRHRPALASKYLERMTEDSKRQARLAVAIVEDIDIEKIYRGYFLGEELELDVLTAESALAKLKNLYGNKMIIYNGRKISISELRKVLVKGIPKKDSHRGKFMRLEKDEDGDIAAIYDYNKQGPKDIFKSIGNRIKKEKARALAREYLLGGKRYNEFLTDKALRENQEKRKAFIREVVRIYKLKALANELEIRRELLKIYLIGHILPISGHTMRTEIAKEEVKRLLADSRRYIFEPVLDLIIDEMARCKLCHKPIFVDSLYQLLKDTAHLPRFAKAIIYELEKAQRHQMELVHGISFEDVLNEIVAIIEKIITDYPDLRQDFQEAVKQADLSQLPGNIRDALFKVLRSAEGAVFMDRLYDPKMAATFIVGVPKEIKPGERRAGLTPAGVEVLVKNGIKVIVQSGLGEKIGISDEQYRKAGAEVVESAEEVWEGATLIKKVKEPLEEEYKYIKSQHIIFTYFHFASSMELTEAMVKTKAACVAYETVEKDGRTILLDPMSEVAGILAAYKGAFYLKCASVRKGRINIRNKNLIKEAERNFPNVPAKLLYNGAKVVAHGGGIVGYNAALMCTRMNGNVTLTEINPIRIATLRKMFKEMGHPEIKILNPDYDDNEILKAERDAKVIICGMYVKGARAPIAINKERLREIGRRKIIIDVSIDQGGNIFGSKPTTHDDPIFLDEFGNIRYCVANMPAAVPNPGPSEMLEKVTLPYTLALAKGLSYAIREYGHGLINGIDIINSEIRNIPVAKQLFRKKARQKLGKITTEERERKSAAICANLSNSDEFKETRQQLISEGKIVLAYMPFGNEVDILPLLKQLLAERIKVGLPRVDGKDIKFYIVEDLDKDLETGFMGRIREPKKSCKSVDLKDAALVITPGLAFAENGDRLGWGTGMWDRFLANFEEINSAPFIAVAFQQQKYEKIPVETHDVRVDAVITDIDDEDKFPFSAHHHSDGENEEVGADEEPEPIPLDVSRIKERNQQLLEEVFAELKADNPVLEELSLSEIKRSSAGDILKLLYDNRGIPLTLKEIGAALGVGTDMVDSHIKKHLLNTGIVVMTDMTQKPYKYLIPAEKSNEEIETEIARQDIEAAIRHLNMSLSKRGKRPPIKDAEGEITKAIAELERDLKEKTVDYKNLTVLFSMTLARIEEVKTEKFKQKILERLAEILKNKKGIRIISIFFAETLEKIRPPEFLESPEQQLDYIDREKALDNFLNMLFIIGPYREILQELQDFIKAEKEPQYAGYTKKAEDLMAAFIVQVGKGANFQIKSALSNVHSAIKTEPESVLQERMQVLINQSA